MAEPNRKLAAILSADVVGYGRLMQDDEPATVATLQEYRVAIGRVIDRHKGRVVNAPGDNILAEFSSAVEAVRGACEIQQVLKGRNLELAPERRMEFRVGVNLGDVIEETDGTIYGDGVNIAARMEALADPGGVCISSSVHDAIRGKVEFGFDFLGAQRVKNIDLPINVYRVRPEPGTSPGRTRRLWLVAAVAGGGSVLAASISAMVIWSPGFGVDEPAAPATGLVYEGHEVELPQVLPLPEGPKIAVLPFESLSDDPSQEIFSDGLTQDISIALSRFQNFFVIAPESTLRFKDRSIDIPDVGRELGVDYVLVGSVRHANERIRITVKVLNIQDQTQVWGDTYDRDLSTQDIFAIQDDIANNIASRLGGEIGQISQVYRETLGVSSTDDLEDYACVLRAHGFYDKQTAEEHKIVRDCLERAVSNNSNYAEAWAWLAYMYRDEEAFNLNRRADDAPPLDRALEAAQRAVALAPSNQLGYDVLASVYFSRREMDLFRVEALKAIELNPNSSRTVAWMGSMMALAGDWEYGIGWLRRSMALNPYHPGWYQVVLGYYYYFHKQDFEQALVQFQKVNMPGWPLWHISLAMTYGQLGRLEEAQAELQRLLAIMPDVADTYRDVQRQWIRSEDAIEIGVEGLRKAGLDIPGEPVPTD